jgi:hypothetical protein
VNASATAEVNAGLPGRADARAARHWIERQLKWERTLDCLRDEKPQPAARRAA